MKDKKRVVSTKFWDDDYVVDLEPIEKLVFLHLLTNPRTQISGVYRLKPRHISFDTGIHDPEQLQQILDKFEQDGKIKRHGDWIALRRWIHNQNVNPSMKLGIKSQLQNAPPELVDWLDQNGSLTEELGIPKEQLKSKKRKRKEEDVPKKTSTYDPGFDYEAVKTKWNDFANEHGLDPLVDLTELRRVKIKEKMSLPSFDFDAILKAIPEQEFLLGVGRDKWKVDFDFIFLRDDSYIKILERKYSAKRTTNNNQKPKTEQTERASFGHTEDDKDRYEELADSLQEREEQWSERPGFDPE